MAQREPEDRTPLIILLFLLGFLALGGLRAFAGWIIEYEWWKELGQTDTLISTLFYTFVPMLVVTLIGFAAFWIAHARGMKSAGTGLGKYPRYAKVTSIAFLVLAYLTAAATVNGWTIALFAGARQLPAEATAWKDPVFQHPLAFYLFDLPFLQVLLRVVLVFSVMAGLVRFLSERVWRVRVEAAKYANAGPMDFREVDLGRAFDSKFVRLSVMAFLLALGASYYLDRYDLLTHDHSFMVGLEYVDDKIRLPIKMLAAVASLAAAVLVLLKRWVPAGFLLALPVVLDAVVPRVVNGFYVRPNEISIQTPYIKRHIQATRAAFALDHRSKEQEYKARIENRIDTEAHRPLLDNVRLWDWRAFHDTITQIQALRPYYVFHDTDVDRYRINGELRQVMLTPREIDVRQLSADAQSRWMNPHFVYTHGYGVVLAEANRITPDGLPLLFIQNAPPEIKTGGVKLTRPEIYYGEVTHEPVFVRTDQQEFNYPSGSENVHNNYDGKGGIPIYPFTMRLASAIAHGDWNILLTGFLNPDSKMLIRRDIRDRVSALADFLSWDADPYLVITDSGRLVWMIDGYSTSQSHPYSRIVEMQGIGRFNYIRNSVKATVDAYDGDVRIYIFDAGDPITAAYARLFPKLFHPASDMPADLRRHTRYPEMLFRAQAEVYRTYHMQDPAAFYNREDGWDIAKSQSQGTGATAFTPTYVVATLPGETEPEFLLMIPFTPRNKDNLIGFMAARCDGDKLGELLFLQLSKQQLIFGPMQIEARINQDQTISKDLTLWNQQGSQVLQGQMLVLPVDDNFIYIKPLYIQASQARMPQLKKVAIAVGNKLAYRDTYEEALAELRRGESPAEVKRRQAGEKEMNDVLLDDVAITKGGDAERKLEDIRKRMRRYRELTYEGKWTEAAKELEGIDTAVSGRPKK